MGLIDDLNSKPVLHIARGLGLRVAGATFGPCPICRVDAIQQSGRPTLPCRVLPDGRSWSCHGPACSGSPSASSAELVLWSVTAARRRPEGPQEWQRIWELVKPWGFRPPLQPGSEATPESTAETSTRPAPTNLRKSWKNQDRRAKPLLESRLEGTRFRSLRGSDEGERTITTLGTLVDLNRQGRIWRFLPGPEPATNLDVGLPCWSPSTFSGGREADNVRAVNAIVIELIGDEENAKRDAAMQRAKENGWACLVYSSYRHEPSEPCWTLVLPFHAPIRPQAYKPLWDAVVDNLGLTYAKCLDMAARTPAMICLVAATHSSRMQHSEVLVVEGDSIDPRGLEFDAESTREIPKRAGASLAEICHDTLERIVRWERGLHSTIPVPWRGIAHGLNPAAVSALEAEAHAAGQPVPLSSYPVMRTGAHLLVGATGSGKTQYALSIALEAALAGHEVAYISLQTELGELACRLMYLIYARERDLDDLPEPVDHWSMVQQPHGPQGREASKRVREYAQAVLEQLPNFRIIDAIAKQSTKSFGPTELGAVASELFESATDARPALLVVDYAQALAPSIDASGRTVQADLELRARLERGLRRVQPYCASARLSVLFVSATDADIDERLAGVSPEFLPPVELLQGAGEGTRGLEFNGASVHVLCRPQPGALQPPSEIPLSWSQLRLVCLPKAAGGSEWVLLGWDGGAFYDCGEAGRRLLEKCGAT